MWKSSPVVPKTTHNIYTANVPIATGSGALLPISHTPYYYDAFMITSKRMNDYSVQMWKGKV